MPISNSSWLFSHLVPNIYTPQVDVSLHPFVPLPWPHPHINSVDYYEAPKTQSNDKICILGGRRGVGGAKMTKTKRKMHQKSKSIFCSKCPQKSMTNIFILGKQKMSKSEKQCKKTSDFFSTKYPQNHLEVYNDQNVHFWESKNSPNLKKYSDFPPPPSKCPPKSFGGVQ